jgi:hypothetical protein
MDTELARRVLAAIEDDAAFDMGWWIEVPAGETFSAGAVVSRTSMCGTKACIAGRTLLEAGYTYSPHDALWHRPDGGVLPAAGVAAEALRLLRLTPAERAAGDAEHGPLFYDIRPEPEVRERFRALVEAAGRKERGG